MAYGIVVMYYHMHAHNIVLGSSTVYFLGLYSEVNMSVCKDTIVLWLTYHWDALHRLCAVETDGTTLIHCKNQLQL